MTVSDLEDRIIAYMEKKGRPLRSAELHEKQLGGDDMDIAFAVQKLRKRGLIKHESIGDDVFFVLVTDIEEMKELALKGSAEDKAAKLVRGNDYTAIIKELLSTHDSMSLEEIYDYLKQNDKLGEDVIRAEKENIFIPHYFALFCISKLRVVDAHTRFVPYVCENGRYRLKTAEEVNKEKQEKIQKEIDTFKLIISTFKVAKKAITIGELYKMNEDLKKCGIIKLSNKVKHLKEIGIVKREVIGKSAYFSLTNVSQKEIDKMLLDIISSEKYVF